MGYATDTEGYHPIDRRLAVFAQNADLLIHDAQYTEVHQKTRTQPGDFSGAAAGDST